MNQGVQEEEDWVGRERQCSKCTARCPINALEVAEVHLPPRHSTPTEVVQAAGQAD